MLLKNLFIKVEKLNIEMTWRYDQYEQQSRTPEIITEIFFKTLNSL